MNVKLVALALIVMLVTAACGDSGQVSDGTPEPLANVGRLPAVEVLDVADGSTVDVSSLLPADKPLLVWFWAPH